MAEKVEIIIEAEDNASGKIEDVGGALESLSSTAMKENLMDLKKAAGGAFSDIGAAMGDVMRQAGEDELVMMRLDQQLKNVGDAAAVSKDDILKVAENLSMLTGFDDEALIEGQTTLLRFGGLSEEQFGKATQASADLAAQLGMDLPGAFQQVAIALDNPENGLGRLGRKVGELTDEQQKAIDKMLEMGDKAGAQGILLDILAGKVNGAAEAYGTTFVGKMSIAEIKVDNFKSKVGDLINQKLPQWMFDVSAGAGEAGSLLGPVVDSLADLGIVLMTFGKGGALAAAGTAIAGMGAAIKTAFAGVAALIGGISLPVLALVVAIGLLIFTIIKFGKDAWENLMRIVGMFEDFKNMIIERIGLLVIAAANNGPAVGKALVDGIKEGITNAWNGLTSALSNLIDDIKATIEAKLQSHSPSKLFMAIGETIPQGLAKGMKNLSSVPIQTASGMVSSMLPSLPAGGGRGSATINITYAPAISAASPQEFEAALVPMVDAAMRRVNRRR